jgi:predicted NAD-dependent protein-ADP-ribosyltransferase YbiA (DUF1768 family)
MSTNNYNDFCLLHGGIYFGKFPDQNTLNEIINTPINCIVNLTEKIIDLDFQGKIVNFPMNIKTVPDEDELIELIYSLTILLLRDDMYIYICDDKGSYRAQFVAGLLYGFFDNQNYEVVINFLNERYETFNNRVVEEIISNKKYESMLKKILKPYHFYNSTFFFCNFSKHTVESSFFNATFNCSEALFQAYKNPDDKKYIEKMIKVKTPQTAKKYGRETKLRLDWEEPVDGCFEKRFHCMVDTLTDKINSHKEEWNKVKEEVKLRPIYEYTEKDLLWGSGKDYRGENWLGRAWKVAYIKSLF